MLLEIRGALRLRLEALFSRQQTLVNRRYALSTRHARMIRKEEETATRADENLDFGYPPAADSGITDRDSKAAVTDFGLEEWGTSMQL
jgi:hypothetical protein